MRRVGLSLAALVVACAPAACGGSMQTPAPAEQPTLATAERTEARPACDADNGGITLPQGFLCVRCT
jgi:hypothetical protein